MLLPAIHNLIFVHSTRKRLTELKTTRAELLPLRYMMHHSSNGDFREIMVVPDKQMEDFIRISSIHDDRVMLLEYNDYLRHVGKRVRIIEGQFAGVEGVIKRIKIIAALLYRLMASQPLPLLTSQLVPLRSCRGLRRRHPKRKS